ncbi:alpha/beta fold hydrolase [Bdellovibrio sp. HCB2-146]|uniref:alpha/beta fold hydrolase n=1 Tax=Bdellovibrio sp. HCB2-146 TaxID=3394362 RepID=UPI0039BCC0A9
MRLLSVFILVLAFGSHTFAKGFDKELSEYPYPFPIQKHSFESQKNSLTMVYMDVPAVGTHKENIVLLHGKNFNGAYFEEMATILAKKGYRVIIPDQIGFGKSTKPQSYQYSFQTLAENTHALLQKLEIKQYQLLGHSMGGMLATRMSLMYPDEVKKLFLVNPIGLEDWKTMTSYRNVDEQFKNEMATTAEKIKKYQLDFYYDNKWKPEYDRWMSPLVGWVEGPDREIIAWTAALTSDMVFTQPVYYEFKNLKMPVILVIGQRDRTAIGKAWAPENMKSKMGDYPKMGKAVANLIPKSTLVELPGLGHLPFIEAPDQYYKAMEKHWTR